MNASGAQWYVVQTQPNSEGKAAAHLLRQGFETYLPRYRKKRRHARKVDTVAAPLFPRYLFVSVDLASQRWRSIRSTVGVSTFVCNGETPATLAPDVVDQLRKREGDDGFIKLERNYSIAPGAPVRIRDGIFESCLGLFEETTDSERVTILLDLLGRKVRVVLDGESVVAV
jgi:transcriptional antiterminator RfaH